jgi:Zn-finger nucleic acid-binding protein
MKCPIDKTELVEGFKKGIVLNECLKCQGLWLRRKDLDTVIAASGKDVDKTHGKALDAECLKETPDMLCPVCGRSMKTGKIQGFGLSVCFDCEGIWLKGQDIKQLAEMRDIYLDQTKGETSSGGFIVDLIGETFLGAAESIGPDIVEGATDITGDIIEAIMEFILEIFLD